jgi:hypothetical protein
VLVVRTPHRRLTWLRALGSRQAAAITAVLSFFTGFLHREPLAPGPSRVKPQVIPHP